MKFKITGLVKEKESGQGVPGLQIRAYDKDLIFDDLLGTATTAEDGTFELSYYQKDFSELFEKSPDIYLSVYNSVCELIADQSETIRWNADQDEYFEIILSRQQLGADSPVLNDNEVEGTLQIRKKDLKITERDNYTVMDLPGFSFLNQPGFPQLPSQVQYIALPLGGKVTNIEVFKGEPVILDNLQPPFPVQEPVPDLGTSPEDYEEGLTFADADFPFTPLSREVLKTKGKYPETLVEIEEQETFSALNFATVRVNPVQYDVNKQVYLFYPDLKYRVQFEKETNNNTSKKTAPTRLTSTDAEIMQDILNMKLVFRAKDLGLDLDFKPLLPIEAPHVIITDNYSWPDHIELSDGTKRPPTIAERGAALSGDLIAEFERLAEWKTAKGKRSRVVTVSQIVDGNFGDMTQGGFARDLPEVIRNFLKHIHKSWKTRYVLLAGDHNVVPIRKLTGSKIYKSHGVTKTTSNPPEKKRCLKISGKSVAKLYPDFTPNINDPLSTYHGGLRIPFDREAGGGKLGWYFTTEDDFNNKNIGFTRLGIGATSKFVIVEGPGSLLDDHYYWVKDVNSIPSDFYYSSLFGSKYNQAGIHDFDTNNNELYGQYHTLENGTRKTLDGVSFGIDMWVGRASVDSAVQATAFVNKTKAYEQLRAPGGGNIPSSYLKKLIFAADWWGKKTTSRQADTSTPPEENRFTHVNGSTTSKIHLGFDLSLNAGVPNRRLVRRSGEDDLIIPYNTTASAISPGWYFTTNNQYNTQTNSPTRFIVVQGPEDQVNPTTYFIWDPVGFESSVVEKEMLRKEMVLSFPEFNQVQRHYADYFDTAELGVNPPTQKLISANLRAAIDEGVHFLSLTGHGWSGGCCGINTSSQPDFQNVNRFFVAYADSCSTAKIDANDSAAEKSTYDDDGGAIAYVGNTRYSWIGIGDNYERFFWSKLSSAKRPGVAANLRLAVGGIKWIWAVYAQNLFGDPELEVYTKVPAQLTVTHLSSWNWGTRFNVNVKSNGVNRSRMKVTVMAGWKGSAQQPEFLETKLTNQFGNVSFALPQRGNRRADNLIVTVTGTNVQPYTTTIPISMSIMA